MSSHHDIITRFRTLEPRGLLLATRDDFSSVRRRDSLEMAVGGGGLVVTITMAGHQVSIIIIIIIITCYYHHCYHQTQLRAGMGLDDNRWHTVQLVRSVLPYFITTLIPFLDMKMWN